MLEVDGATSMEDLSSIMTLKEIKDFDIKSEEEWVLVGKDQVPAANM